VKFVGFTARHCGSWHNWHSASGQVLLKWLLFRGVSSGKQEAHTLLVPARAAA